MLLNEMQKQEGRLQQQTVENQKQARQIQQLTAEVAQLKDLFKQTIAAQQGNRSLAAAFNKQAKAFAVVANSKIRKKSATERPRFGR